MPALRGSTAGPGWIRSAVPGPGATALLMGLVALAGVAPRPVAAVCSPPLTLADRWDDVSPIPGYAGETRRSPDWRNNGVLDHEAFTDLSGNRVWDPGEPYVDANGNGRFDAELYGPLVTGYVAVPTPESVLAPAGDLGREILIVPASSPGDESPGHYLFLEGAQPCPYPWAVERPNGADTRAIDDWLAGVLTEDPDATLDPATWQIVSPLYGNCSPRLMPLYPYDPRAPLAAAHGTVEAAKLLRAFVESRVGKGAFLVRIAALAPPPPGAAGVECASASAGSLPALRAIDASTAPAVAPAAARPTTWGGLKAVYR